MKKIIAITSSILLISASTAFADGIQSPRGISESAWQASSAYKNFTCPEGYNRGDGLDLNFTADRSDDFYYVECYLPVTFTVVPDLVQPVTDTITTTTAITDTPTVITTASSNTVNTSTVTDTNTVTNLTNSQIYALILELFNKLIALIGQLK